MSAVNPYAPPTVDVTAPVKRAPRTSSRKEIQAALAALREHLASPARVREDERAAGGRLRMVTVVLFLMAAVAFAAGVLLPGDNDVGLMVGLIFGGLLVLVGAVSAGLDLAMVSRRGAASPVASFKSYVRAFSTGRFGYAWACLCPTARAQHVQAPELGAVVTGTGSFSMETQNGVKRYAQTFARPSGGYMRTAQIRELALEVQEEDVTVLRATLRFQSWPQWANLVLGAGLAAGARIGGTRVGLVGTVGLLAAIAGLIGLLFLRKRHTVTVRKTLLRGTNGAWYIFDPDLLEGAAHHGE
jgi:phosphate/sulfate permease